MRVVIINASPFQRRSNTSIILNAFISGLNDTGSTVELFNLVKLTIHPCRGDLNCWFRTRGQCIQRDDMDCLYEPFTNADAIVFSTPVYCDGVPGQLKIMMDRLVAGGDPFLEIRDNHSRHPATSKQLSQKFVLIASCGLWELDNFDPMIMHLKAFCNNMGFTFCGSLLRPHAFAMKNRTINDILKAAKNAGKCFGEKGTFSETDLNIVKREIISRKEYIDEINAKVKNLTH
jgi:putative NADPH-quinone reductase